MPVTPPGQVLGADREQDGAAIIPQVLGAVRTGDAGLAGLWLLLCAAAAAGLAWVLRRRGKEQ